MLDNCKYNKIKLIHELSSLAWFLEKHGIPDAKTSGENDCAETFKLIKNDLEKNISLLTAMAKK